MSVYLGPLSQPSLAQAFGPLWARVRCVSVVLCLVGMASPAFPKFALGAGMSAPPMDPLMDLGSVGAPSGTAGGPTPAPPPVSIEAVRAAAKVPDILLQAVLAHPKADPTTLPEHLACVSDEDFAEAADKVQVNGEPLSGIQKGQVVYFVKMLRQAVDQPVTAPVPTPAVVVAPPFPEGEKRKISEVLDQVDDGPYLQLAPEKVAQMRQFHRDVTGGDPPDHERPTAEQLSALAHRIDSGKVPFADFAVFGPYGRRQTKLLRFTAQVFIHGELATRQLRGPGSS